MDSAAVSTTIVELHTPGPLENLVLLFIFLLPFIFLAIVFGFLIKMWLSASSSIRAKRISGISILILLSIIIVFLSLYLPKTINDPNELNHIACGYPFQYLVFSSYRSPPFPWTNNCIGWVGEGITDVTTTFLKTPFVLNISVVFTILFCTYYLISLIRHRKINIKIFIVIFIFLMLIINYAWQYYHPRGAQNKEQAVKLFLEYLTKKDIHGIQRLTPEHFENKKEIRELMEKYGGNKFENIKIDFKPTESSVYWPAAIKGLRIDSNGRKRSFTHFLTIEQLGIYNFDDTGRDRWYIMIGKYNNPSLPSIGPPIKIEKVYKENTK